MKSQSKLKMSWETSQGSSSSMLSLTEDMVIEYRGFASKEANCSRFVELKIKRLKGY